MSSLFPQKPSEAPRQRFLIATSNPHKTEEIRRILARYPVTLIDLLSFPPLPPPIEKGNSFLANAQIKSDYYASALGLTAIADDSGLEVDALNGLPGIHSARYAGDSTPHTEKIRVLLQEMEGIPPTKRSARFCCVTSVTFPDGRHIFAEGAMEGRLALSPAGDLGFGYDPIVELPHLGLTVAQLSPEQKDELSHRGLAFRRLMDAIKIKPTSI